MNGSADPTLHRLDAVGPWQLACSDFGFPLLSHDQALDLIRLLGFRAVGIGLFARGSHVSMEEVERAPSAMARRLSERIGIRGLEIADVLLTPGPDIAALAANHPDSNERQRSRECFLRALEFAVGCGCRHLTALPGIHWEGEPYEDSLSRASEELAWRTEQSSSAGIVFAVEPHLGSIISTPAQVRSLLQRVCGLTLTLDYGHFTAQGIADVEVHPLLVHATHFHARGAAPGMVQAPMKANQIDFSAVLNEMDRQGYRGCIELEYYWEDSPDLNECDTISQTILLRHELQRARSVP